MFFDVENGLEGEAQAPEECEVGTDGSCEQGSAGEGLGIEDAEEALGGDGDGDVGAVDPVHLALQYGEAGQLGFPIQAEGDQGGGAEDGELGEAGEEDQCGKMVVDDCGEGHGGSGRVELFEALDGPIRRLAIPKFAIRGRGAWGESRCE